MAKYIAKGFMMVFGVAVIAYVLTTADFFEFNKFNFETMFVLIALATSGVIASVSSFSVVVGNGTGFLGLTKVATASLGSTIVNLVAPLVGTSGKIAHLKWGHGLALRETTSYLLSILVARFFLGSTIFSFVYFGLFLSMYEIAGIICALLSLAASALIFLATSSKSQPHKTSKKTKLLFYFILFDLILFCTQALSLHIVLSEFGYDSFLLSLTFAALGLALGSLPSGFLGIGLREGGLLLLGQFVGIDSAVMSSLIMLDRAVWILGIVLGLSLTVLVRLLMSFIGRRSA